MKSKTLNFWQVLVTLGGLIAYFLVLHFGDHGGKQEEALLVVFLLTAFGALFTVDGHFNAFCAFGTSALSIIFAGSVCAIMSNSGGFWFLAMIAFCVALGAFVSAIANFDCMSAESSARNWKRSLRLLVQGVLTSAVLLGAPTIIAPLVA